MVPEKFIHKLTAQELAAAAQVLHVKPEKLKDITVLKKGMTNHSFLFTCNGRKYIMRIPGEGTDKLIDRSQEAKVYQRIQEQGISDRVLYIDPCSGYKITEYIEGARTCNPLDERDIRKCMGKLRQFHGLHLTVDYTFDLFQMIDFYESLRKNVPSAYPDYEEAKKNVWALKAFIDSQKKDRALSHIDPVPENFLLFSDEKGNEEVRLIDWEYAGMQDPHLDIAMFCVYAMYDKYHIDHLIQVYFQESCDVKTRIKIYCYIAACGLLWSNWCEYKRTLGIEFGEYSLQQYRFAKEYYTVAVKEMEKLEEGRG